MSVAYKRYLADQIRPWLFMNKVVMIYGARQVGKTTVARNLISDNTANVYLNCELGQVKSLLEELNPVKVKNMVGDAQMVVLDEAQKVANIGTVLKLLVDTYPAIQWIATGSSSFDLSNQVNEPLTGRNVKFVMYPLSLVEMEKHHNRIVLHERLEGFLRFGMYPDIVDRPEAQQIRLLDELATDYLYRDVLEFQDVRNSSVLLNLLKALALQLGHEVSYRELSNMFGLSVETVQRYLMLLEQSFVIFRVGSFSRNLRKELVKSNKYYFCDLGIRNSLIQNYNPLSVRTDVGALWENFCLLERMKWNAAHDTRPNLYFWRTYDQKEIDLVEESAGELRCFEFKWNEKAKTKVPKEFLTTYPNSSFQTITPGNYWEWFGTK